MKDCSILVNTCDSFEDCWDPFFRLWSLYGPGGGSPVYLNTEFKHYVHPEVPVIAMKSCAGKPLKGGRASWSQCLKWALESLDTSLVLYLQEDYFLTGPVDEDALAGYADMMLEHAGIPCIHLTREGIPARAPSQYAGLFGSDPSYPWYVCCQASLWRRDILLSLLRDVESAWKFELYGSMRARYSKLDFLTVDPQLFTCGEEGEKGRGYQIIPYIFTGIVHGKWYRPVVDLFDRHGIEMDYDRRGFFNPSEKRPWTVRIANTARNWKTWRSRRELRGMKRRFLREERQLKGKGRPA